ncbi:hypothetical protein M407DRAFT_244657 [Tulasnella calospora MUT 4182]|uniref:Uncharacterized protein n=1 Tax=Tulasnella calospora MUT 4182 TaxID=1051891 RepID=A0A0C3Q4J3_9AGAM|nr:hypothetical protein M407DRAFT_246652 [Tulasnella calospora MUT 4182]KIO23865.1 hypothetical protein M407DRAFT_244657 [Tulasnella calospora MUT 4182]
MYQKEKLKDKTTLKLLPPIALRKQLLYRSSKVLQISFSPTTKLIEPLMIEGPRPKWFVFAQLLHAGSGLEEMLHYRFHILHHLEFV